MTPINVEETADGDVPPLLLMTEATRNRRRMLCRKSKALADLYSMAGMTGEALHLYNEAIDEAKAIQDLTTQAAAVEGVTMGLITTVWWSIKFSEEVNSVRQRNNALILICDPFTT